MTPLIRHIGTLLLLLAGTATGAEPTTKVTLTGRVVDSAGKPVGAAKLEARGVRTTADGAGRFRLEIADEQLDRVRLVAAAPGFAPYVGEIPAKASDFQVMLPEGLPVEGRILSLEGQPVAGAEVRVVGLDFFTGGALDPHLEAMRIVKDEPARPGRSKQFLHAPVAELASVMPELATTRKTDRDGRFRIPNVGRDRLVFFRLSGPAIQHLELATAVRSGKTMQIQGSNRKVRWTVLNAPFDYLAIPSRLVRGVVREKGSGNPIAGIEVSSLNSTSVAVTDAAGRYELAGCAKAPTYEITAMPPLTVSTFAATRQADDAEGLVPISVDIDLLPGVRVKGRILDGQTGEQVAGATRYYPLPGNDYLDVKPDFTRTRYFSPPARTAPAPGEYSVVVAPGPGVITVRADAQTYKPARIFPRLILPGYSGDRSEWGDDVSLNLERRRGMYWPVEQSRFRAIEPINPVEGTPPFDYDIMLAPEAFVRARFVDPDGHPLVGVWTSGLTGVDGIRPPGGRVTTAEFRIRDVSAQRPMIFYAVDPRRGLCGKFTVQGDETRRIDFRLEPGATLTGRLVDAAGKPVAGVTIWPKWSEPGTKLYSYLSQPDMPRTDAEGKFTVRWLMTGCELGFGFAEPGLYPFITDIKAGIAPLSPGETRDVGKLTLLRGER